MREKQRVLKQEEWFVAIPCFQAGLIQSNNQSSVPEGQFDDRQERKAPMGCPVSLPMELPP